MLKIHRKFFNLICYLRETSWCLVRFLADKWLSQASGLKETDFEMLKVCFIYLFWPAQPAYGGVEYLFTLQGLRVNWVENYIGWTWRNKRRERWPHLDISNPVPACLVLTTYLHPSFATFLRSSIPKKPFCTSKSNIIL